MYMYVRRCILAWIHTYIDTYTQVLAAKSCCTEVQRTVVNSLIYPRFEISRIFVLTSLRLHVK